MKNKRLVALTLAGMMGLTSLAGATTAFAAEDDSVYVSIEKSAAYKQGASTIDYILAPKKVDLATVKAAMGDNDALTPADGIKDVTILDVLLSTYGKDNFTYAYNANYHCYYVSAIKDSGTKNYVATQNDYTYGTQVSSLSTQYSLNTAFNGNITKDGWLTENDLVTNGGSGWLIAQNNVGPYYGVSTKVEGGNTLRMEWSTFNGMDVGYAGYLGSNWTQVAPFIYASSSAGDYGTDYVKVNKDALVKKLAEINNAVEKGSLVMTGPQSEAFDEANDVLKNIEASSNDITEAVSSLSWFIN